MQNLPRPRMVASNAVLSATASSPPVFLSLVAIMLLGVMSHAASAQHTETRVARNTPTRLPDEVQTTESCLEKKQRELYDELTDNLAVLQLQSALLRKIVYVVRPSVVHIIADKKPPAGTYGEPGDYEGPHGEYDNMSPDTFVEEAGSGVVIGVDGKLYVLTNRHVVRDATIDHIHIELANGRQIKPHKKWSDESTDVALLELQDKQVLPARLGDSSQVEMGDLVLAIGSPFGLNHSVTHGIISAKGRRDLALGIDEVRIQDFLQTDAAINPGNSGGPLINMRGEVIGLNTAIASNSGGNEGIGFAIPMNMAVHVARQLIKNGSMARPYLGVRLDHSYGAKEAHDAGLPRRMGTRIAEIAPGSPAEHAELEPGDVIVKFNHIEIEDDGHLVNLVGLSPLGLQAPLDVLRAGKHVALVVLIQERQESRDNRSAQRGGVPVRPSPVRPSKDDVERGNLAAREARAPVDEPRVDPPPVETEVGEAKADEGATMSEPIISD
jgi:serine protease Do